MATQPDPTQPTPRIQEGAINIWFVRSERVGSEGDLYRIVMSGGVAALLQAEHSSGSNTPG